MTSFNRDRGAMAPLPPPPWIRSCQEDVDDVLKRLEIGLLTFL